MASTKTRRGGNQLADAEAILRRSAAALLVDPRTLRRVIKHDRGVTGLVPHTPVSYTHLTLPTIYSV